MTVRNNNNIKIIIICIVLLVLSAFFILSTRGRKSDNSTIKPIERPASVAHLQDLNISPKIPIYRVGQKLHFKIVKEVNFSGDIHNAELTFMIPENIPERQRVSNIKITPEPQKIVKRPDGNYAVIYLPNPKGSIFIIVEGDIQVRTYNLNIAQKINKNIDGVLSAEEKASYLQEEPKIEVNSKLIKHTAQKIIPTATNDVDTVKNIFDYVFNRLRYNYDDINKDKGALLALTSGTGVCEEFSKLFTALCRAKGIPARIRKGFELPFIFDDSDDIKNGHAWVEVYFDKYGWVTFDPTNKIDDNIRIKMQEKNIFPYDFMSELIQNRTYLISDTGTINLKAEGDGDMTSKISGIYYSVNY